jgi:hypothetical protein
MNALRSYQMSIEARRSAHFARRTKLPGWRIYFKAAMRRAITKWRQYAEEVR